MSSTELRVKELLRERGWTTKVLAEKTGLSESYLTHIKNGTRRWNEDALKKLASAFGSHPVDLFAQRRTRTDNLDSAVKMPENIDVDMQLRIVPVVGDIPANPSPYTNQLMQITTGHKDVFVPVANFIDDSMFCLSIENNNLAPTFFKGDYLIVSPETWTKTGEIGAVEYGNEGQIRAIMMVSYVDEFVVLESLNHKSAPVALVRGKDYFRSIGKVVYRYQRMP